MLFDPSVGNIGNDTVAVYVQKAQNIINLLRAGGKKVIYQELVDRGVNAATPWKDGQSGHTDAAAVLSQLVTWCSKSVALDPALSTRDLVLTTNANGTTVPKDEMSVGSDDTDFTPIWGRRIGRRIAAIAAANMPAAAPFHPAAAGNITTNYQMSGNVAAPSRLQRHATDR
ncbi:hypothetical protein AB5I41_31525 [Sphingomonas sp. MMS24-JH45]